MEYVQPETGTVRDEASDNSDESEHQEPSTADDDVVTDLIVTDLDDNAESARHSTFPVVNHQVTAATTNHQPDGESIRRPSPAQQLHIATSINKDSAHSYAVSRNWLRHWKDHVTNAESGQPGPIEMDSRSGATDTNEYVPEKMWRHLVTWFGVSAGHHLDRKHNATTLNDEISFEICTLSPYSGIVEHLTRNFNRFEEVGYVEFQLRRIFNIVPICNATTRLWISERERLPPRFRFLANRKRMLKDFLERDRTYLLALEERRSADDPWPTGERGEPTGDLERYAELTGSGWEQTSNDLDQLVTDICAATKSAFDQLRGNVVHHAAETLDRTVDHVTELNDRLRIKKAELSRRRRVLDERRCRLCDVEADLERDRQRVDARRIQLEADQFRVDERRRTIDRLRRVQDSRIRVDVGGTVFVTSRRTMVDGDPDSLLAAMFPDDADRAPGLKPEEDGSYFVDRDGAHFRYVLDWLRDGSASRLPRDVATLRHVLCEAKFYRLRHLVKRIETRLTELNVSIA